MIEIENLNKSYGAFKALTDFNMKINKGGVVAFLGPNGAGKSTLIRIITGAIPFDSGKVIVCGSDIRKSPQDVKQKIGYLPENNPLYEELRVSEFLFARAGIKGLRGKSAKESVSRSVSQCKIEHVQNRIIGQLSKGYRQRVGLADSMLGSPELLIFDEPMVGLDPNQLRDVRHLIAETGRDKTVFLSTHVLHDVEELAGTVVIINKGRLVAVDSPRELMAKSRKPRKIVLETIERGNSAAHIKELESVAELTTVENESEKICRYILETRDIDSCRNEVINLFSKNGWFLQEMRLEPVRLDDIFSEITEAE